MDFKTLAENRYSCRKFSDKKVSKDLILDIIKTANLAPTAVNKQPVKVFYMESDDAKAAIKKATVYDFGAPSFLVVGYNEKEGWVRPYDNKPFAVVDASIVSTHIMLALKDLGLDTTWVGYFNQDVLKELYPEMKDYQLIAIFPIGYKAVDGNPSPRHLQRKPLDDFYTSL